jgi:hypothetical protein
MKKFRLITFFLLLSAFSFAQVSTNLLVAPTPPSTLTDWSNRREVLTFVVVNQSGASIRALVKADLKTSDGTQVAATNLSRARIISFAGGSTQLFAMDVLALESMNFFGKYKSTLDRTGKLPAGSYQLCVQLVTPVDFIPLSQQVCRNFNLAAMQLPIAMIPAQDAMLDAIKSQTAIIFRWTPVSPQPSTPVIYHVQVFEVLSNQTPMQAFRSNQPILDKEVVGMTQFIWQPQMDLSSFCCGIYPATADSTTRKKIPVYTHQFVWTIQSFDTQKRPIGDGNVNGDGRSEPSVFFIRPSH